MPGPALLVVGFDAADRDVVDRLVAAGRMPTVARLMDGGHVADVENPFGMLSGPVWPTVATGVSPDRHGAWSWRRLRPGTYRLEHRGPNGPVDHPTFWSALARDGITTAVVDLPNVALQRTPGTVEVVGWSEHERRSTLATFPEDLAPALQERFPVSAVDGCDDLGRADATVRLRSKLLGELEQKVAMLPWLVDRCAPDVLVAVFSEAHCAGHQLWHLHDPRSRRHDPERSRDLGDPMADVYVALDVGLAELLVTLRPTHVAVLLSHGMTETVTAAHLVDPVLRRIDARLGPTPRWAYLRELARRTPNRVARRALRATRRDIEPLAHYVDGSRRLLPLPNFPAYMAIRLNLRGREPAGLVDPVDAEAVMDLVERELLALRVVDDGRPAVQRVVRVTDRYPRAGPTGMPDLLVEWDVSAPMEAVQSPTLGEIRGRFDEPRPGAHLQDGRLVLRGPGVAPGRSTMRAEDVAPTLAALVGARLTDVDGEPIGAVDRVAVAR